MTASRRHVLPGVNIPYRYNNHFAAATFSQVFTNLNMV